VAHCYGANGNASVDRVVILEMMFLPFFDDAASERELMKGISRGSIIYRFSVTAFNASWRQVI